MTTTTTTTTTTCKHTTQHNNNNNKTKMQKGSSSNSTESNSYQNVSIVLLTRHRKTEMKVLMFGAPTMNTTTAAFTAIFQQ
jgi:hypothetical protein